MGDNEVRVKLPEDTRNVLRRHITGSFFIMPDKTYVFTKDQIATLDKANLEYEVIEDNDIQ